VHAICAAVGVEYVYTRIRFEHRSMHVVGVAYKAGWKRSWAPGCGLAIGALADVYTYIHSYIDIYMHG
jgi:hypothetical protein